MRRVAKLILINEDSNYLLLTRANHPLYGNDPDLPGGIVEENESLKEGVVRELHEETGIELAPSLVREFFTTDQRSGDGRIWSLWIAQLETTPPISLSWEHGGYEWLDRSEFLTRVAAAKDVYMHMVSDELVRTSEHTT